MSYILRKRFSKDYFPWLQDQEWAVEAEFDTLDEVGTYFKQYQNPAFEYDLEEVKE